MVASVETGGLELVAFISFAFSYTVSVLGT